MAEGSTVPENQEINQVDNVLPLAENPQAKENFGFIERIDDNEIVKEAKKLGKFLNLPQKIVEDRMADVSVYMASGSVFEQKLEVSMKEKLIKQGILDKDLSPEDQELADSFLSRKIGKSVEEVKAERLKVEEQNIQIMKEHAKKMGGAAIINEKGATVFIKEGSSMGKKAILPHELIHILTTRRDMGKNGDYPTGIKSADGEYHYINEAATEVLRLAYQYPELTVEKIARGIVSGEIKSGYGEQTMKLLTAMCLTSEADKPFTVDDLSRYYAQTGEETSAIPMQWDLIPKIREDRREQVKKWFEEDLKGEIGKTT